MIASELSTRVLGGNGAVPPVLTSSLGAEAAMRGAAATQLRRVLADPTLAGVEAEVQSSSPPWRPPPPERSTSSATQRPLERRTMASMLLWPERRLLKQTRSKRVLDVIRIVTVPRSESRSRNVRSERLTETTVPSYSRVAAEAVGAAASGGGGDQGDCEEFLHGSEIDRKVVKGPVVPSKRSVKGCQVGV